MTRVEAGRELRKRWGKNARCRVGTSLSSPEERDQRLTTFRTHRAERDAIDAEIKRRLEAEPWYQDLMARRKTLVTSLRKLDVMPYYKFTVGHVDSILGAFHVEGEGDTWEEAFAKADKKS